MAWVAGVFGNFLGIPLTPSDIEVNVISLVGDVRGHHVGEVRSQE
jgi:hypothetical protein